VIRRLAGRAVTRFMQAEGYVPAGGTPILECFVITRITEDWRRLAGILRRPRIIERVAVRARRCRTRLRSDG
jgi:hypothetical protein